MEILRFIRWQWGQTSRETKQIGLMVLFAVVSTTFGWLYLEFGFMGIMITAVGSFIFSLIGIGLWENTIKSWNKYKRIKESEAEDIMRRLRG